MMKNNGSVAVFIVVMMSALSLLMLSVIKVSADSLLMEKIYLEDMASRNEMISLANAIGDKAGVEFKKSMAEYINYKKTEILNSNTEDVESFSQYFRKNLESKFIQTIELHYFDGKYYFKVSEKTKLYDLNKFAFTGKLNNKNTKKNISIGGVIDFPNIEKEFDGKTKEEIEDIGAEEILKKYKVDKYFNWYVMESIPKDEEPS